MPVRWRARSGAASRRRSGPRGEEPWWDPAAQERTERPILDRRTLGRGWLDATMLNNTERLDPLGEDEASTRVRSARQARRLIGLDEGRAWRRRNETTLVVSRVEVFAEPNEDDHRTAWQADAQASLDATWRLRWAERDLNPGWIEATWVAVADRPGPLHAFAADPDPPEPAAAVDWLRIEDHTDPRQDGSVVIYEHLTLWAGVRHAVLTARHDLGVDLADNLAEAAAIALGRLHA